MYRTTAVLLHILTLSGTLCAQAPQPSRQVRDSFPPIILTLPLTDTYASATLGHSKRSVQDDSEYLLKTFVGRGAPSRTDQEVKSLVGLQTDFDSLLNKEKIGINLSQFTTDKFVDFGSGALSLRYPGAGIVTGAFADAAKKGLGAFYERQRTELDQRALHSLQTNLSSIPRGASLTAGDIRNFYRTHGDALLGTDVIARMRASGASEEEIQAILADQIDRLVRIVAEIGADQQSPPDTQSITVRPHKTNSSSRHTAADDARFLIFERRLSSEVRQLNKGQSQLRNALKQLNATVMADSARINDIYQMLFSQLPASTQRKALVNSIGGRTPTPAEQSILEGLAAREFFDESLPAFAGNLKDLGTIATNVGLPPEYQKAVARSITYVNTFDTLGKAALSNNPLGVFASMTSLFAGGGSDPEELRFNAIMQQLNEIKQNQVIMMHMLADLAKAISQIMENIERIDIHLGNVALTARDGAETSYGLRDCEVLNGTRLSPNSAYTYVDGSFRSFEARRSHYLQHKDVFDSCFAGLRRIFLGNDSALSQLFQQDFDTDSSGRPISFALSADFQQVVFMTESYVPEFTETKTFVDKDKVWNRLFVASLDSVPLTKISALRQQLKAGDPDVSAILPDAKLKYLSLRAMSRYIGYLLEYYPYFVFSDGKQLRLPATLLRDTNREPERERRALVSKMLVFATRLVNTAIAQQELMDGSLTVETINESFLSWKWPEVRWCRTATFDPNYRSFQEDQTNGRVFERNQFISDNSNTLSLLARRTALRNNWIKNLVLETLLDPTRARQRAAIKKQNPTATQAGLSGYFIDRKLQGNYKSKEESAKMPFPGSCGAALDRTLFPGRDKPGADFAGFSIVHIPYSPANTEITTQIPNEVSESDDLNMPEHGPEMFLLHDLRRQLLASLLQIDGFATLNDTQKKLAAYLLIQNVRASD